MTSSRQSVGEGKKFVRRGSASDLTLSGRARARILWAKLMGLPLGLSIKRPHRSVVEHGNSTTHRWQRRGQTVLEFFEAFAHIRLLENGANGAVAEFKLSIQTIQVCPRDLLASVAH